MTLIGIFQASSESSVRGGYMKHPEHAAVGRKVWTTQQSLVGEATISRRRRKQPGGRPAYG